jgi:hypothetical protein
MVSKNFGLRVAGSIFGIVAILHLLRLLLNVSIIISGWLLPTWINGVGFIGAALFCILLWKLAGTNET